MGTDEVLAAVAARAQALAEQDAVALERSMLPLCRWTTHAGLVLDRDEYIARNITSVRFSRQVLLDPVVRIVGATAVVTGTVVDTLADGEEFRMLLTMTWVRDDDAWRLLAGHAGPRIDH